MLAASGRQCWCEQGTAVTRLRLPPPRAPCKHWTTAGPRGVVLFAQPRVPSVRRSRCRHSGAWGPQKASWRPQFCCSASAMGGDADAQWELLQKYHSGSWHGNWCTLDASGEIVSQTQAVTDVSFSEDETTCSIRRTNYEDGNPSGEGRGGSVGKGGLPNRLAGPMYQGCVVAGQRIVFEGGTSYEGDIRLRVAVEYHRPKGGEGEAAADTPPELTTVTVIQEQQGSFPPPPQGLNASSDLPAQRLNGLYTGQRFHHDGSCTERTLDMGAEGSQESHSITEAMQGTWAAAPGGAGSTPPLGSYCVCLGSSLWLSAPMQLLPGSLSFSTLWCPTDGCVCWSTARVEWPAGYVDQKPDLEFHVDVLHSSTA